MNLFEARSSIREMIKEGHHIMVSSWGVFGLEHSENKLPIIKSIISNLMKDGFTKEEAIETFCSEMELYYREHKPMPFMTAEEIHDIVIEEKTYITHIDNLVKQHG